MMEKNYVNLCESNRYLLIVYHIKIVVKKMLCLQYFHNTFTTNLK